MCLVFLFFKQKTAYEMRISDWSSDVCSSDLLFADAARMVIQPVGRPRIHIFPGLRADRERGRDRGGCCTLERCEPDRARWGRHTDVVAHPGALQRDRGLQLRDTVPRRG